MQLRKKIIAINKIINEKFLYTIRNEHSVRLCEFDSTYLRSLYG